MIKYGNREVRKKLKTCRLLHFATCESCKSFYKKEGEAEESCHNSESTDFDRVEDGTRVYCCFWDM